MRTLNAIALAIVNGSAPFARRPRQLRTVSEGDVRRILGRLVRSPRRRNTDPLAVWVEALGLARLGLRDPDEVEAAYDGDVAGFAAAFPQYRKALASDGTVDFDEQVQLAIELLLADPVARAGARRACGVLLVDEFQDLAPAHLLLVRLLAGPDGAVFGVGDDDQTIYGYNGADPAWLIDFAALFPGAGMHPLEVNYRCPGGVVEVADRLLRHNRRRVPKTIRSAKPDEVGWSVRAAADGNTLAVTVDVIREAVRAGRQPGEIAVLTRVNALLAPVQVALRVEGVPINGGVGESFTEQASIRAALAWLRLCLPDATWTTPDLAEALRRPSRPLHPRIGDWVGEQRSIADLLRLAARLTSERDAERVEGFAADVGRLSALIAGGGSTAEFFTALRESVGLDSAVATLDLGRRGMNRTAQNDDLTALAQIATMNPDAAAFEPWLRRWLREPSDGAGVVLATVHRVKGLEWPMVVVHHADADQFPHRLADDGEEERRLFHVALDPCGRRGRRRDRRAAQPVRRRADHRARRARTGAGASAGAQRPAVGGAGRQGGTAADGRGGDRAVRTPAQPAPRVGQRETGVHRVRRQDVARDRRRRPGLDPRARRDPRRRPGEARSLRPRRARRRRGRAPADALRPRGGSAQRFDQEVLHGVTDAAVDVVQVALGGAHAQRVEPGDGAHADPLADRRTVQRDRQIGVDEHPLAKRQPAGDAVHEVGRRRRPLERADRLAADHRYRQSRPHADRRRRRCGAAHPTRSHRCGSSAGRCRGAS